MKQLADRIKTLVVTPLVAQAVSLIRRAKAKRPSSLLYWIAYILSLLSSLLTLVTL